MKKPIPFPQHPSADPVSLAAAAVHSLIQLLPSGTAFFIGVVLIVMMTGRLVHHKGRLARASRTLKVRGGIISQANRYLGGFCFSQRIFPPQIIQVLLKHYMVSIVIYTIED